MKIVAEFDQRLSSEEYRTTVILRDAYGKWYVRVDGEIKQKRLNASEIVRYLANMMHEE